jgi:AmmeMemoRadiSam system protein B/AmmeMemoRadiSam system protein A
MEGGMQRVDDRDAEDTVTTRPDRSRRLVTVLVILMATAFVALAPERARAARARPPALAGTWYPDGRARLISAAHFLMRLAEGAPGLPSKPVALVVPHAGWNYSGFAAGAAYRLLEPGDFDRVVVVAPSHHGAFRGYALDDATAYRTPLGEIPLCEGAAETLTSEIARYVPGVAEPEHAVEIELPFLQAALGRFCLVPVLVGDTTPRDQRAFAARLAALDDGRTLFVFSSDFAHYGTRFGYEPFGALSLETRERIREMDGRAVALLAAVDTEGFRSYLSETGNTICGRHGLATMLELLPLIAPEARAALLAQYMSADLPIPHEGSSVSYVTMAFVRGPESPAPRDPLRGLPELEAAPMDAPPLSGEEGSRLVRLARAALETQLRGEDRLGPLLATWPSSSAQERRQGVFVTLSRTDPEEIRTHGPLRGCIGQAEPRYPLYYGTVQAALDAALRDDRFEPVQASELERLAVEVTVLSPRRPVASPEEIRLGIHGIVLEKDGKAALFLPQVATQQEWSLEETLGALARKAGLDTEAWKDGADLSVFTGQVFGEEW